MTTSTMSDAELRQTNASLVKRYLALWNVPDVEAVGDTLHSEVELEQGFPAPGAPGVVSGKENVMVFLRTAPTVLGPMNFRVTELSTLEDPNEVVVEYSGDSVVLESEKPYRNRYITRVSIQDGLIRRFCEYGNPLVVMEAFGTGSE
jgi:ketosteroid isomerase-like protein